MSPAEFWKRPGPSLASLGFLWMLTSLRLSLRRICVKRKQEPGRALAQGGVFSWCNCFPCGRAHHRAKVSIERFREKAPSEERIWRCCSCDAGS